MAIISEQVTIASLLAQVAELKKENEILKKESKILKDLSNTDQLTGIGNRRRFDTIYSVQFNAAVRYEESISLIIFDIDNFKNINTVLGHIEADRVLCQITALACRNVRKMDTICRHGGEEFAILLPRTNLSKCLRIAERVRASVEKSNYTISLGVGSLIPKFPSDQQTLLKLAYGNMATAKKLGKNRVHCSQVEFAKN